MKTVLMCKDTIEEVRDRMRGRLPLGGIGADHEIEESLIELCEVLEAILDKLPPETR